MAAGADVIVRPQAKVQADPVAHGGDAADDSAIRVHSTDPAGSLILGTDKHGGLCVYGMEGRLGQLVSDDCRPNNVDALYGFRLGRCRVDLAAGHGPVRATARRRTPWCRSAAG